MALNTLKCNCLTPLPIKGLKLSVKIQSIF